MEMWEWATVTELDMCLCLPLTTTVGTTMYSFPRDRELFRHVLFFCTSHLQILHLVGPPQPQYPFPCDIEKRRASI
jgi:hypothetical protein